MAQDEIIVTYKVDASEFGKVGVAVNSVTGEAKELETQIKSTFSEKAVTEATAAINKHADAIAVLIDDYGSVSAAVKAVKKDVEGLIVANKKDTDEYKKKFEILGSLQKKQRQLAKETKAAFSDTRTLDLFAQGARGIAAAFQVGIGAVGLFGKENEDLQKTLVKVNSAMALLAGVQEVARIATEENGIATKAYGVALTVVDKISKVTGFSMAASWALATGGITLVIGALTTLYFWFQKNQDAAEETIVINTENAKKEKEKQEEVMSAISKAEKKKFEDQEYYRKKRQIAGEDSRAIEVQQLEENIAYYKNFLVRSTVLGQEYFEDYKDLSKEQYEELRVIADKYTIDAEISRQELLAQIRKDARKNESARIKQEKVDEITAMGASLLVTKEDVEINKINSKQQEVDFKQYALDKALKDQEEFAAKKKSQEEKMWSDSFALAQGAATAIAAFVNIAADNQLQSLTSQRDKDLAHAGDNAEKKKKIEQKFAIESAKIQRQKAITEKAAAIFSIAISLAQTIQKIQAEAAVLSSNPVTAALAGNAYAQIGIAAALSALQIGVIAAQPLPQIPKFEKGGKVLAGGRNDDGHLIGRSHRERGILIEAQGGEYIWDREATAKHGDIIQAAHENRIEDLMMHKYVVPMMKNKLQSDSDSYDDWLLRATIKSGQKADKKNAEYIAEKVSQSVNAAIYNQNRYR